MTGCKRAHLGQRQLCLPDRRQRLNLHEPHRLGLQPVLLSMVAGRDHGGRHDDC